MVQASEYASSLHWNNFLRGITTDATYDTYTDAVKRFMKYLNTNDPADLLKGNTELLENQIIGFIAWQKEQGLSSSIIKTRKSAIKLFYEMNRVPLTWKHITKTIGKTKKRLDKAYTREQIAKVLDIADAREKVIVMLFAATGVREGSISELTVGDLIKIDKYNIYKIIVYRGYDEEYFTFCTPEARIIIDNYLDYRRRSGEEITESSPLIREQFNKYEPDEVKHPRRLATRTILNLLIKLLVNAGVRKKVHLMEGQVSGRIRHDVKAAHGFRKFFDTETTSAGMNLLYVEMLEGHNPKGVKGNYFRPGEKDLLEGNDRMHGYVDVIDALTIDPSKRLQLELIEAKEALKNSASNEVVANVLD